MKTVYLSTGSNLNDRQGNLNNAIRLLDSHTNIRVCRVSSVYETEPWGYADQPAFLNQIVEIETDLAPLDLLRALKALEKEAGRVPTFKYGPRVMDVDIIFYGGEIFEGENLSIPHPQLEQRAFVLVPLAELAGDFLHPRTGQSVKELMRAIDTSGVKLWSATGKSDAKRGFPLNWGSRTYVMGILNITPDSFSGDGLLRGENYLDDVMQQAHCFVSSGADILDIGAESTRPGAQAVPADDEIIRTLNVIRSLRVEFPDVILSIDTYKASVAQVALKAGADWINDVWGLRADEQMANLAGDLGVPLVLMHNRSRPADVSLQQRLGGRYVGVDYDNLIEDVKRELMVSVNMAHSAGVRDENIILDPGIGFGKTVEQNLELLDRLGEIRALGFPVLLGSSRKSFIGYTLDLPPDQRIEGTAASVAVGIARGADIIRVHDVEFMVRVARMTDAIVRRK